MNLGLRIGALSAVGVGVAGLAHAGWLALFAGAGAEGSAWVPVAVQASMTAVLAAAVGWQVWRSLQPLQQSLQLLGHQADALEQGRFVVVADPPLADAVPLARSLNAAVRRLQAATEGQAVGAPGALEALRRTARTDLASGLDSRFTFLHRLTERLAAPDSPETGLVALQLATAPGHELLTDVAALLRTYLQRVPGTFVGRLSDTEFAVCLPAHGVAGESAASLLAATGAAPQGVRAAVVAVDHLAGVSLGSALALLDRALEQAREAGPGQVEAVSARAASMISGQDAERRRAIVEALRGSQFRLAEFPVVDRDGRLLHLECPMRLQLEAGRGYEPAEAWLAVATRYRLMTQIDLAALELALAASAADGRQRCVHVSAESLAAAGFVSAVRARLEAAPVAATRLCIEIAEVSFERLPPRLRNAGTVWRRCGTRVGIEHAGAALRSLVRLGELELDYVKVDASFVRGLATSAEQRERAQGLVAFVHAFGARVIAEGVDREDDLQGLWALGFDGATGRAATAWHAEGQPQTDDQAMSPA